MGKCAEVSFIWTIVLTRFFLALFISALSRHSSAFGDGVVGVVLVVEFGMRALGSTGAHPLSHAPSYFYFSYFSR
jgi:hypothetical protein